MLSAGQNRLLPHARDTLALGREATASNLPSFLGKTSSEPVPPPFPSSIPDFQLHLTFKSSSMKTPKDKLFEICSVQSGVHPERTETFPTVSLSFGRFCNSTFQIYIHGKCTSNWGMKEKTKTLKVLNPTYWLKLFENISAGGKASWKVSVVLASPPGKIFSRHQLTVFAMIKDMISKCKLLFLSLFILGLKWSLVKWQSSISVHAWACFPFTFPSNFSHSMSI